MAELGRRGLVATAFAGNVPDIDLLAYRNGRTIALQVKSVRTGSVSFDAKRFMTIEFEGDRQIITETAPGLDASLIFVFVSIGQRSGEDGFFILDQGTLQGIVCANHAAWLAKHGGIRPKNPQSTHTAVSFAQLDKFRDNWSLIETRLSEER
ncbi:hypothetical protein [Roseinatronobacter monicus]|uniref:hypothetical protein n=1 Tax=Roseinatronobacter monicus TaxID=393481 RepID=UPI0011502C9B|nr:hypothetical protein [Roseinatronobacter monicus]